MQIYYEGNNIGSRRVDFLVEEKIAVEIKALTHLEDVHIAQAKNYLPNLRQAYGGQWKPAIWRLDC